MIKEKSFEDLMNKVRLYLNKTTEGIVREYEFTDQFQNGIVRFETKTKETVEVMFYRCRSDSVYIWDGYAVFKNRNKGPELIWIE